MLAIPDLLNIARAHHAAGRLAEAEVVYQRILAHDPNEPDALHLIGLVAHARGRHAEAEQLIRRAIALRPRVPAYHNNLGEVLRATARPESAAVACREAIRLNPNYPEAHNNLGAALAAMNRHEEATAAFRAAIRLKPDYANAWRNLATACAMGHCYEEGVTAYRELARLRPNVAPDLAALGALLLHLHRYEEALESLTRAVELDARLAAAWNDLGVVSKRLRHVEEMTAAWRRAVALAPDEARYRWFLGMALLEQGHFAEGWAEYEWRWATPQFAPLRKPFARPRWDGRDPRGKTIYVQCEQGLGDTIHFARYLPMVADRGANVILEAQPEVVSLLQSVRGVSRVVTLDGPPSRTMTATTTTTAAATPSTAAIATTASMTTDAATTEPSPPPPFDAYVPLLSLAKMFGTRLETIPADVPYLAPPADAIGRWRHRLNGDGNGKDGGGAGLRVALTWTGSPLFADSFNRSCRLADFAPLAGVAGVRFFSLQKGLAAAEAALPPAGMDLTDLSPHLSDMAETAAVLENLDLLISTDTAVVHLAGALARPVWTLLARSSDWRWLHDRADSPWYPTMRLYRQTTRGDWRELLERVAVDLAALVATRCP